MENGISYVLKQQHPPPRRKSRDSFSDYVLLQLQDPFNWLKNSSAHTVSREGQGKKEGMGPTPDGECVFACVREEEKR